MSVRVPVLSMVWLGSWIILLFLQQWHGSDAFHPSHSHSCHEVRNQRSLTLSPSSLWATPSSWFDVFNVNNEKNPRRELLTQELLQECRAPKPNRSIVKGLVNELSPLCPTTMKKKGTGGTAQSPLLQKTWLLEWTTEQEINWFIDWGISSKDSITQSISSPTLRNVIPFRQGNGSLSVEGRLSIVNNNNNKKNNENSDNVVSNSQRTYFEFTSATLDLGTKWGCYDFPPIGRGWFDTIYLDNNLRIDTNSRNDILICTPLRTRNNKQKK